MLFKFLLPALAFTGLASSSALSKLFTPRSAGTVQGDGGLVVIDPAGIYIRATTLTSGSILVGYTDHANGNSTLMAATSSNGGGSWSVVGSVETAVSATSDVDNAMPLQLPSGRIIYAFRNHDKNSAGDYTYYRITVCYSDDGGATWQYLSQVDQRAAAGVNGLWEPFLRVAADGSVQCYYSSELAASDQNTLMRSSTDGGATWSDAITVSGGDTTTSRDGMSGVAETDSSGQNLICVFENTEDAGLFRIDYVTSSDGGSSWGDRTRLYTPPSGSSGAPQVVNVGGTLVVSFMSTEATSQSNNVDDDGQMRVVTSTDGGSTWSGSVVTGAAPAHWPGLYTTDDTHFLALYAEDGSGAVSQLYGLV